VLGEELGHRDLEAEFVWVLNPIDGTANYITGLHEWATLIGLCKDGRPVLGVIDQPVSGDRWVGLTFGSGRVSPVAYHNGTRIHVTEGITELGEARLAVSATAALRLCDEEETRITRQLA